MDVPGIATRAQMACILEVTCPKPGNVSRFQDFEDTRYEHFLAGCMGMGAALQEAAERGFKTGKGSLDARKVGLGELIEKAVKESRSWHRGGNTNLGTAVLLVPLSASAGRSLALRGGMEDEALREGVDLLVRRSTYEDSLHLYEAIRTARPGGLGSVEELDVNDKSSDAKIRDEGLNLYHIMDLSQRDSIARELVTRMEISFKVGYPAITHSRGGICEGVLRAFFEILSRVPDSLIAGKNDPEVAEKISLEARGILEGGLDVSRVQVFDEMLRSKGNKLNPGTTADLVASSLMIALLNDVEV